jgi:hypothetical protein
MGGQSFELRGRGKRNRQPSWGIGAGGRGQMMLIVASALVALLGFAAIATDVGLLWNSRRQMQTAADSAAIAGEQELVAPNTGATVTDAADEDSASNGFANGVNGASVTVNNPPLHGAYTGNTNAVEVIVSQSQPTFFLRALGLTSVPVLARAVGVPGSGTGCIFSMNPSANNALVAFGSASISAQCGIWVDSSSTSSMVANGSACIVGGSINLVASSYSNQSSCAPSPTPTTGLQAVSDPLAYVPAPSTSGSCTATNYTLNGGTATISHGIYCGGITVQGNGTLTLNAGTYILMGGGLTVSGGSNIIGNGVTFYNTKNSTYSYKPITVSGGSTTSLIAPTTGSLEGILFFEDRSITSSQKNAVSGTSGTVLQGALYFLNDELDYSGGSSATAYTISVANIIQFTGPSVINDNYTTLADGSPIRVASLGE